MKKTVLIAMMLVVLSTLQAIAAEKWTASGIIEKRIPPQQLSPAPVGDDTRYGVVGVTECFADLRQIGVSWAREEIGRAEVSALPKLLATKDWPRQPVVAEVRNAGGQMLGLINFVDPEHQWARDKTESYLPQVEAFCERLVTMYKDDVKHWEIMNEPDYFWPEGSPKQTANIAIAAAKGIRRADPQAIIFSPCPTRPAYMEALLQHGIGPVVDGFSIHLYTRDEALLEEVRTYKELFHRFEQGAKPIWVTETGYKSAVAFGPAEKERADWFNALQTQAQEVVKLNTLLFGAGIQRVFWYDATDVASIYDGENFGLFWSSPNPNRGLGKQGNGWGIPGTALSLKPAGLAMHMLAGMVGTLPVGRTVDLGEGISAYTYGKENASVLVVWAANEGTINLPVQDSGAQLTTLYGERHELPADEQKQVKVTIGPAPVYLNGVNVAALVVDECRIVWPEDVQTHPGVTTPVAVHLENHSDSKAFDGTISFLAAPGIQVEPATLKVHLEPGQKTTQTLRFGASDRLPVDSYALQWRIDRGREMPALLSKRNIAVTPPVNLKAEVGYSDKGQATCELRVMNKLATPISGSLEVKAEGLVSGSTFPLTLDAKGSAAVSLPISDLKAQTPQVIHATWSVGGGTPMQLSADFKEQLVVYREGGVPFRGRLEDWTQVPSLIHLTGEKYFVAVSPTGKYDGPADLGADCYALWDASNLYLAFHVLDNAHVQTSASFAEAWKQDSIQFTLDMGDQKRGTYDNDDFEIILSQGPDGPQVGFVAAPLYGSGLFKDAELKVSPVPGGLLYECRVPWNRLGLQNPAAGRTVGFSFLANDDDNDGQGRNWMEWTAGIGLKKDTGSYGTLRLVR